MERSISQGSRADGQAAPSIAAPRGRRWEAAIGLAIAGLVLLIYLVSNPGRYNFYDHFTWQAAAWLEGQVGIEYPVCNSQSTTTDCVRTAADGEPYNDFFLDVLPVTDANGRSTGRALIPFPPLPAIILLPFVALWGLHTYAQLIAAFIGGLDVWLAWWVLGRLSLRLPLRAAATFFFGIGTVFWYTAMLGTTWYQAHVVAVGLALLAIRIALGADRRAVDEALMAVGTGRGPVAPIDAVAVPAPAGRVGLRSVVAGVREELADGLRRGWWTLVDRRQFLAGLLLGLAATARLTVALGLPFLVFVGGGRGPVRRTLSAGLGMGLPLLALAAYNVATTGHVFHPAYEYLYQNEAFGYPELGYNPAWSIEDLRYVPQNVAIMFGRLPEILPACTPGAVRGVFSTTCAYVVPDPVGMSLLLTSPAYLLAVPALVRLARSRLIVGATLAIVAIAFVNLMHFSQGWVQFGYRFSNDFAPFALLLVALGIARIGRVRGWVAVLVALSIAINAWGVAWGVILGW